MTAINMILDIQLTRNDKVTARYLLKQSTADAPIRLEKKSKTKRDTNKKESHEFA